MILQALVEHYEALAELGKISPPGWAPVKVSYALRIDEAGALKGVTCIKTEQTRGKKTVPVPQLLSLPAPVKRTVGIDPNFLCDNSSYTIGADNKGKPQRAKACFEAARNLHHAVLDAVDTPAARSLLAFFDSWNPDTALQHPLLQEALEDILAGSNLIFRWANGYIHDDPAIRSAWDRWIGKAEEEANRGVCLVTGREDTIEAVHPSIKGVQGAQSSGASLISFNGDAFCSYGKEQNFNAPVGKYAAFAYTTALNALLADRDHVFHLGDTTVICWAQSGESQYQDVMGCYAFDAPSAYEPDDILALVKALCQGEKVCFEESMLSPDMKFYILGLSPNAARLSVRFFLRNSFGAFLQNVLFHHQRMEIVRPSFDKFETLPLWKLMDETVNQNARNKAPSPNMAGETLRAILNNTPYPALLLNGVTLRIRAESEVTRGRAAILKAYYLKNEHKDVPKEVLTVALNPESTNIPYTLGRLFSVLEDIQSRANPGINSTIKDRYFNSASATPAHVFPTLVNLAQKHLKKIEGGMAVNYSKQLNGLISKLGETYPNHLSLPEQGSFQLGYYHQTQDRYTSKKAKEENENG